MNDIEKARIKVDQARRELLRLERAEQAKKARSMKNLVGTCYKTKNCYSCPQGPEDYWWLYRRIIAIKRGMILMSDFEIDKNGELRVTPKAWRPLETIAVNDAERIPEAEYRLAIRGGQAMLAALLS